MSENVYAVYDLKAKALIGGVFTFRHDAAAVRYFIDGLTTDGSMLKKHPQDFQLMRLAAVDLETASIIGNESPAVVLTGEQWLLSLTPDEDSK